VVDLQRRGPFSLTKSVGILDGDI